MIVDVNVKSRINNDDVIVFRNGKWENVHKGEFLGGTTRMILAKEENLKTEIKILKEENSKLKEELKKRDESLKVFQEAINTKLKEHHNVLQTLTGAKNNQ